VLVHELQQEEARTSTSCSRERCITSCVLQNRQVMDLQKVLKKIGTGWDRISVIVITMTELIQ
jgi:hypothetical protein